MNINKIILEKVIKESKSKSEIYKKLELPNNGNSLNKITKLAENFGLTLKNFKTIRSVKYELVKKNCPVCNLEFETKKGIKKEKITCSYSCANSYFRSGENNPNYKDFYQYAGRTRLVHFTRKYRKECFKYHKHECVICKENKMLDVHHFDEDRLNNKPDNLIPICATHHNYLHSKYRDEVIDKVIEYRNNFIKQQTIG